MKTFFIGVVLLFLFSACTTIETPAPTLTPKADNPTLLQEIIEVTPAGSLESRRKRTLVFGWSPSVLAPFVPVYDIWLIVRSGEICAHSKLAYVLSKDV